MDLVVRAPLFEDADTAAASPTGCVLVVAGPALHGRGRLRDSGLNAAGCDQVLHEVSAALHVLVLRKLRHVSFLVHLQALPQRPVDPRLLEALPATLLHVLRSKQRLPTVGASSSTHRVAFSVAVFL